jgi:hypothetical protein
LLLSTAGDRVEVCESAAARAHLGEDSRGLEAAAGVPGSAGARNPAPSQATDWRAATALAAAAGAAGHNVARWVLRDCGVLQVSLFCQHGSDGCFAQQLQSDVQVFKSMQLVLWLGKTLCLWNIHV